LKNIKSKDLLIMDSLDMQLIKDREASELLEHIYEELKYNKEISEDTKKFLFFFFEDEKKFVNERRRELRREAGCRTYIDEDGCVRLVSNGELEYFGEKVTH